MTFTNRVGQNMFLKFSSEDESKVLRASDIRVSFVHQEMDGPNEIQVNSAVFPGITIPCFERIMKSL